MFQVKKILYPCELSENVRAILPVVLFFARKFDSRLYLLHVVEELARWETSVPKFYIEKLQAEAMEFSRKAMDKLCDEEIKDVQDYEKKIVLGDAVLEILKMIQSEDIHLVVMGTHGHKSMEEKIFGSVTDNLVKQSPVPVLVVNPYRIGNALKDA